MSDNIRCDSCENDNALDNFVNEDGNIVPLCKDCGFKLLDEKQKTIDAERERLKAAVAERAAKASYKGD